VIRAYVHDNYAFGGLGVAISIVNHPPEGSMDVRPRLLHLGGGPFTVAWNEIPADGAITEPTLTLGSDEARALLDALTRHYQGAEDTRALRRDYDGERKRVDTMIDHLAAVTRMLAGEG
jgi:hypothetical protein